MNENQIGRLALRVEGNNWIAYYAALDTMKDSIFLGSIAMSIVEDGRYKQQFMDLMSSVVQDLVEDAIGIRPTMPGPQPAPESERSGNA